MKNQAYNEPTMKGTIMNTAKRFAMNVRKVVRVVTMTLLFLVAFVLLNFVIGIALLIVQ